MVNNPYQSYSNTQAMTATPGELTLMLYNGAVRFLKMAKAAIEEKQIEASNNNLQKVQNIIVELMTTLNMDFEVSQNLWTLYDFMRNHLIEANLKKDPQLVQDVIELMEDLRNTWAEAVKLARTEKAVGANG
jgi:flagellar protein FliS